jgi:hypothetical protein
VSDAAIAWIITLAFLAIGIAILVYTVHMRRLAKASLTWPTTEGTVVDSGVMAGRSSKGGRTYSARVRYTYAVGGTTYDNDTIQFGSPGTDQSTADATVAEHPVGKRVNVHYNPHKPAQAVLKAGVTGAMWTFFLYFCAVLFIGFATVMIPVLLST